MKVKPYPSLLFWQICVLAAVCGAFASQYRLAGAAGLGIILLGLPLSASKSYPRKIAVLSGFWLLALFWSLWLHPTPPISTPEWFSANTKSRITGEVVAVDGLPDRRLRILLKNVRPADLGEATTPLSGLVAWTWDLGKSPNMPRILPGQTVEMTTRLRPVTGFANAGGNDAQSYFAARNVWYTAWSADSGVYSSDGGDSAKITIGGQPDRNAAKRDEWRALLTAELGGNAAPQTSQIRQARQDHSESTRTAGMGQAEAILPALIFGDRFSLDTATLDMFVRTGLIHSLALSGQHLALAGTVAALLIWLVSRGSGKLLLRMPRRAWILVLGLPLAALYLWIGSAPLPLIRAALMMFFGALLWLNKRPTTLLDLLFFATACFLLVWPQAVFDLSVQLSMFSVVGIALSLPILRDANRQLCSHLPRILGLPLGWGILLLGSSLAVQITTMPFLAHSFGRQNPLFFLNLIWLPLLGIIGLPLGALGLFFLILLGPQNLSDALFALSILPSEVMIAILNWLGNHNALFVIQNLKPHWLTVLGFTAATAAFCMQYGRRFPANAKRVACCALILLPLGSGLRLMDQHKAAWRQEICMRVLDVGQGESILLEWPGGRLLYDAGGVFSNRLDTGRDIIAHVLTDNKPPHLNLAIASHGDLDHIKGYISLLETFRVDMFVRSYLPFAEESDSAREVETMRQRRNIPLLQLAKGDRLPLTSGTPHALGELALEVLHPPDSGRFSSNNSSLVLRLTLNGKGLALLCGDIQSAAIRQILRSGQDISAEVLIIPHHGSATSLVPEFYAAVNPDLAIIPAGLFNGFGFPKLEVIETLESQGVTVLTTSRHGEIRVTWNKTGDKAGREIRPFRQGWYLDLLPRP